MNHLGPQVGDQEAPEGGNMYASYVREFGLQCQKDLHTKTQLQVEPPISFTSVGSAVQRGSIDNQDTTDRRQPINKEAVSAVCSSFSSNEGKKLRKKLKAVAKKHKTCVGQDHHGVRGYMNSPAPSRGDTQTDNQNMEEQRHRFMSGAASPFSLPWLMNEANLQQRAAFGIGHETFQLPSSIHHLTVFPSTVASQGVLVDTYHHAQLYGHSLGPVSSRDQKCLESADGIIPKPISPAMSGFQHPADITKRDIFACDRKEISANLEKKPSTQGEHEKPNTIPQRGLSPFDINMLIRPKISNDSEKPQVSPIDFSHRIGFSGFEKEDHSTHGATSNLIKSQEFKEPQALNGYTYNKNAKASGKNQNETQSSFHSHYKQFSDISSWPPKEPETLRNHVHSPFQSSVSPNVYPFMDRCTQPVTKQAAIPQKKSENLAMTSQISSIQGVSELPHMGTSINARHPVYQNFWSIPNTDQTIPEVIQTGDTTIENSGRKRPKLGSDKGLEKQTKKKLKKNKALESGVASVANGGQPVEGKNKDKVHSKGGRRKKDECDDPDIMEIVQANVQQILAACREKELEKEVSKKMGESENSLSDYQRKADTKLAKSVSGYDFSDKQQDCLTSVIKDKVLCCSDCEKFGFENSPNCSSRIKIDTVSETIKFVIARAMALEKEEEAILQHQKNNSFFSFFPTQQHSFGIHPSIMSQKQDPSFGNSPSIISQKQDPSFGIPPATLSQKPDLSMSKTFAEVNEEFISKSFPKSFVENADSIDKKSSLIPSAVRSKIDGFHSQFEPKTDTDGQLQKLPSIREWLWKFSNTQGFSSPSGISKPLPMYPKFIDGNGTPSFIFNNSLRGLSTMDNRVLKDRAVLPCTNSPMTEFSVGTSVAMINDNVKGQENRSHTLDVKEKDQILKSSFSFVSAENFQVASMNNGDTSTDVKPSHEVLVKNKQMDLNTVSSFSSDLPDSNSDIKGKDAKAFLELPEVSKYVTMCSERSALYEFKERNKDVNLTNNAIFAHELLDKNTDYRNVPSEFPDKTYIMTSSLPASVLHQPHWNTKGDNKGIYASNRGEELCSLPRQTKDQMINDTVRGDVFSFTGTDTVQKYVDTVASQISQLKDMITGEDELVDRLKNNRVVEIPKCGCLGPDVMPSEDVEGPYYTHLGTAKSVKALRELMETRTGLVGKAIRIEKIRYTGKEGKSSQGCPIAKWVIRRSGPGEKYLCLVRQRLGHTCETACILVVVVAWEGVETKQADDLYSFLIQNVTKYGYETERRCGTNERKTCACQGIDLMRRGASFSFGCSWSMYFNGCKFARSREVRKFKLKNLEKERELEGHFQSLATNLAPLYKQVAPDAYRNQTQFENEATDCRLGLNNGRPFSGVTACVDFCAHSHKDLHNMYNGSTVVVTLTKHRGFNKPDDEQLHVLPLYVMESTDENESYNGQWKKIQSGALEVLHKYPLEARIRAIPLAPCKRKRGTKDKENLSGRKRKGSSFPFTRVINSPRGSSSSNLSTHKQKKASARFSSQDSDLSVIGSNCSSQSNSVINTPVKNQSNFSKNSSKGPKRSKKSISYDDLMLHSSKNGFGNLYESFWDYFYATGSFPPPTFLSSSNYQNSLKQDKCNGTLNTFPAKYDYHPYSNFEEMAENITKSQVIGKEASLFLNNAHSDQVLPNLLPSAQQNKEILPPQVIQLITSLLPQNLQEQRNSTKGQQPYTPSLPRVSQESVCSQNGITVPQTITAVSSVVSHASSTVVQSTPFSTPESPLYQISNPEKLSNKQHVAHNSKFILEKNTNNAFSKHNSSEYGTVNYSCIGALLNTQILESSSKSVSMVASSSSSSSPSSSSQVSGNSSSVSVTSSSMQLSSIPHHISHCHSSITCSSPSSRSESSGLQPTSLRADSELLNAVEDQTVQCIDYMPSHKMGSNSDITFHQDSCHVGNAIKEAHDICLPVTDLATRTVSSDRTNSSNITLQQFSNNVPNSNQVQNLQSTSGHSSETVITKTFHADQEQLGNDIRENPRQKSGSCDNYGQCFGNSVDISSSGSQDSIKVENPFEDSFQSPSFDSLSQVTCNSDLSQNERTSNEYDSPLHLLSEAVMIHTKNLESKYQTNTLPPVQSFFSPASKFGFYGNAIHSNQGEFQSFTAKSSINEPNIHDNISHDFPKSTFKENPHPLELADVHSEHVLPQGQSEGQRLTRDNNGCMIDPTVVKCEMEYNEGAFSDPNIGGVAIALAHGSVLFEVAKRELHATTGLKNPNRFSPTRISLVFYQHKNLNYRKHGYYMYEKKLEMLRQERIEKMKAENNGKVDMEEINNMFKGGKKKKKEKKEEVVDITKTSAAQYKYMWDANVRHSTTHTTDSIVTRWIDPQPMVTGPYQKWV
ncbi:hypothetical protein CHS0354_028084 [Potamilus streckersoni]|uniref:Methylcytosine dioxygenase TET n=1 Tax=Potamilus streckersoni TaxID=2493646 RepID=A0AAE0WER6_9BIVA|nr:hypothetical protein CHS0354_028084 [Potamilus streckersoni]